MNIKTGQTVTIKPAKEGVNVPKPNGKKLSAKGEEVVWSSFWVRRKNDNDIVIVEPSTTKSAKKGE